MSVKPRHLDELRPDDFAAHRIWRFAPEDSDDETCLVPVRRKRVSDLAGCVVVTEASLANGTRVWAALGNLELEDPESTEQFLTLSVLSRGRWFHLARYFDVWFARQGPTQLAKFLRLRPKDVFPILYDVSESVRRPKSAARGFVRARPRRRLSKDALIALAIR